MTIEINACNTASDNVSSPFFKLMKEYLNIEITDDLSPTV